MSIPNADDYERIEDIEDVRTGDIVVSVSGNWYTVRADLTSEFNQLYCTINGDAKKEDSPLFFFDSEKFDYALRKKPRLPDKPGLWKDKNGDIWLYSGNGTSIALIRRDREWEWLSGVTSVNFDRFPGIDFAPFTPCKIVEES